MRRIPLGSMVVRCALGSALCAWIVVGVLSVNGEAQQARPLSAGVYSAAQAARGQAVYKEQCGSCHGEAMEGTIGPAMAGAVFLEAWSARPLNELVEKIQKTMPFNLPGSLSRQQSIDLAAYINIIFNLQVKDPTNEKSGPAPVPFDYVKWGATIYPGWLAVDQAALAIAESAPLLLTPGRRCQNGRPAPVDRADYRQYVADMVKVAQEAYKVSKARNFEAFVEISDKLNTACANCHMVYRDKGGPEGSGAARCI
jgi:mono/diheme cytochrome c family protein